MSREAAQEIVGRFAAQGWNNVVGEVFEVTVARSMYPRRRCCQAAGAQAQIKGRKMLPALYRREIQDAN
jgi:hypothetical protein